MGPNKKAKVKKPRFSKENPDAWRALAKIAFDNDVAGFGLEKATADWIILLYVEIRKLGGDFK